MNKILNNIAENMTTFDSAELMRKKKLLNQKHNLRFSKTTTNMNFKKKFNNTAST